ncbi:MAG: MFS transporter [Burkholderiales bacterium]|nr:MFS transporter [Burkholderiales bacterium]
MPLYHGWKVVAACFVVAIVAWALGLFGSSVYLAALTAHHGWDVAAVASAITVFLLTGASLQRAVAHGIARFGPRPVLGAGAVSLCAGVALLGMAAAPWQLYPCFILVGAGWATLSTSGIGITVAPWFERHQGRSMTLAIMGASVGGIVGVPALLAAIAALGLRGGLLAAAGAGLLLTLPLILHILRHRGPADIGALPDGAAGSTPAAAAPPPAAPRDAGLLLWSVATAFALALTVQVGFIAHHLMLAMTVMAGADAALLVSATALAGLVGRLVLARIVDGVRVRLLAAAVMAAQAGALAALWLHPAPATMVAASLVYGYAIGHVTTLAPVIVRREFGPQRFAAHYARAATLIQFSSACGPWAFGALRGQWGGYAGVLAVAAAAALAAALILVGAARRAAARRDESA